MVGGTWRLTAGASWKQFFGMTLIDSHAHLTFPELAGQIDSVLERCAQAGVEKIITIGVDLVDAQKVLELCGRYPQQIFAGIGFHPHEAGKVSEKDFLSMAELWIRSEVVALGEMGLDYHYDLADRDKQKSVFLRQLELASSINKPIVIHCREAIDDTILLLLNYGFENKPVVFHCFTGSAQEAERCAQHGWRISFTGIVTFPKSTELQAIAREYPADQLMVETDSPYLSPVPVRNKRPNEPAHIVHTAQFLADLRGESFETFAKNTFDNTIKFFNLQ